METMKRTYVKPAMKRMSIVADTAVASSEEEGTTNIIDDTFVVGTTDTYDAPPGCWLPGPRPQCQNNAGDTSCMNNADSSDEVTCTTTLAGAGQNNSGI